MKPRNRKFVDQMFSWRMLVASLMGFACGVPLLLTGSVLQAWMTEEGVELSVIGLFSLAGLPYALKFLWMPVLEGAGQGGGFLSTGCYTRLAVASYKL